MRWREDAAAARCSGPDVDIRLHTFDETNRRVKPDADHPHDPPRRRPTPDRAGRRAVEPVSARGRSGAAVSRRRLAGLHRRLSRLRLYRHAAGAAGRHQSRAGDGHFILRRRGRGAPARRGAARRLRRRAQAALQLHERSAGAGRRAAAVPAAQARPAHLGLALEHRSRPRLPLPMLVLHHHQRAGTQEPHPLGRRSRKDRARELCARASSASSSPTTISPATRTGSRCSTA